MIKQVAATFCLSVMAASAIAGQSPHTWHNVFTTAGTWNATLTMISEKGWFVDKNGAKITNFSISPSAPVLYGFNYEPGSDFDVAYTLTVTKAPDSKLLTFQSKACVFVITAAGPANPDIRPTSFNGATCDWKVVPGKGEDFTVS